MIKCRTCGHEGEETDFGKQYKCTPPKPSTTCHECRRVATRDYWARNRTELNQRAKNRRVEQKKWAVEYKGGKCQHCFSAWHPAAFDFHHIDPKTKELDPGLMMAHSKEKLKEELDKCILLCSNCHRIHHFEEGFT